MNDKDIVVLQALDKITARISTQRVPVGKTVSFGSLHIKARTCRKTPPEDPPEAAAFLQIWEIKQAEEPSWVFSGWMFSSSPALSAMEHAVYDIWILDCIDKPTPPPEETTE